MRLPLPRLLQLTTLLCASSLAAQNDDHPAPAIAPQTAIILPTEIVVTPLMNRRDIRSLISKVQEEFINRFNQLNRDDDFDIECYKYSSTTSHIRKDVCEPKFLRRARAADASLAGFNLDQTVKRYQLEAVQVQTDNGIRAGLSQEYVTLQRKVNYLSENDRALKILLENLSELNYQLDNYRRDR